MDWEWEWECKYKEVLPKKRNDEWKSTLVMTSMLFSLTIDTLLCRGLFSSGKRKNLGDALAYKKIVVASLCNKVKCPYIVIDTIT
jgi:hypothetical protein